MASKSRGKSSAGPSRAELLRLYETMALIRAFEERFVALVAQGKFVGTGHLYVGQEAVAAGVCATLQPADYVTSTHSGHGHCLAKGVDPNEMMAELFGKVTGTCGGKGGSMHIADFRKGMLGANGIVGAGLPIACGAALTAKVTKSGRVAVAFFGDGAANIGAFHEALNLASVWKLPVVFVCENNRYGEATPVSTRWRPTIADRAAASRMPGTIVTDRMCSTSTPRRARLSTTPAPERPCAVEARRTGTTPLPGDAARYRSPEEIEAFKSRDCIQRFGAYLTKAAGVPADELERIAAQAEQRLDEAVAFAEAGPSPQPEDLTSDVDGSYG
jgi:TPP-dependent pyruvate/acetoin dehydrogenase alpha subunit